ncbi:MAG: formate--tetrahydrofolate ligase [Thermoleophilia bacterium]|nr:MAG: formate--tetrahydrofolate ligase [Thermoleophilia bacterium]
MKSSLEIAQEHVLRPIADIAAEYGIEPDELELFGRYKAKVELSILDRLKDRPDGKIINVTAITPTPAGEGKTTTSVSLTQGMGKIGRRAMLALREPSLGPVFGVKGGAAGGGYAQVVPMEDLNLHFTGDVHAITAANNLLSALVDAHIFHGHSPQIANVTWRRAIDVTDRSLRNIVTGLGGAKNGIPAESGFDITAASEVMAIMALATDVPDLRRKLGAITVGYTKAGDPVTAEDIKAAGSMAVLLRDAIKPNIVQTLEGQLCLMHCGPFANIAHGNNSIIADRIGLKLGEYLITEAGFAADLGMEKFMDVVCRVGGLKPHVVVIVATVRALRHHGGGDWKTTADMAQMRSEVEIGMANLAKHIENVRAFGIQPVVTINTRPDDEQELLELIKTLSLEAGAYGAAIHNGFGAGGEGTIELAEIVVAAAEAPSDFKLLYEDSEPVATKIERIAKTIYGADGIDLAPAALAAIARFEKEGIAHLPICMAKSHLSLSHDPTLRNRPTGFTVPIRDIRSYTGAGMLVPLCGDMLQMPGFGAEPAANQIDLAPDGTVLGLF